MSYGNKDEAEIPEGQTLDMTTGEGCAQVDSDDVIREEDVQLIRCEHLTLPTYEEACKEAKEK